MSKTLYCIIVSVVVMLSSCSQKSHDKTPDESAKEMITNIVVCFEMKDKETLKSYFSEHIQENSPLDSEIEAAFEFIDSEIVSVGEPNSGCIGPIDDKAFGGDIKEVITDKGTIYKFDFKGMYRYDEDKSQEGVTGLCIINMSDDYDYENPQKDLLSHKITIGDYYSQSD